MPFASVHWLGASGLNSGFDTHCERVAGSLHVVVVGACQVYDYAGHEWVHQVERNIHRLHVAPTYRDVLRVGQTHIGQVDDDQLRVAEG